MRIDIKSKKHFNSLIKKLFPGKDIPVITGCSINSKNIKKGDMFFPLKGERFNGHDFINEAMHNGAALIISEQKFENIINTPIVNVPSTVTMLKKIASKWRSQLNLDIIGITGSNGKTSTKEILNNIISKSKKTMCSKGNYNSTIGLPMSILEISHKDEIGILEIGANKPGEIKELSGIANPSHGLVTNISNAHNEYFGNIANIAKNKIDLLMSLSKSGYAFINMDCSYLNNVCGKLKSNIITYGFSDKYDFTGLLTDRAVKINGHTIDLPYQNKAIAQNYLAAYSICSTIGINPNNIVAYLKENPIYPGRGELILVNNITYINDTYNANLASYINGLNSLKNIQGNKKIIILGDMHELGKKTKYEHINLGKIIKSLDINAVFGLGDHIKYTLDSIKSKKIFVQHFNSKKAIINKISTYCNKGDIIYIKGSRSMKMEEIIPNRGSNHAL